MLCVNAGVVWAGEIYEPIKRKDELSSSYRYEEKLGQAGNIDVKIVRKFDDMPNITSLTDYDQIYPQRIALYRAAVLTKSSGHSYFQVQKIDISYRAAMLGIYLDSQEVRYQGKIVSSLDESIECRMRKDESLCSNYDAEDVIKSIGPSINNYYAVFERKCVEKYKYAYSGARFLDCVK